MLRTIRAQNVRQAYSEGIRLIAREGIEEPSRNGPVLVLDGPLITTYEDPTARVLLDPRRDANPFFHLMEAFWMLAGRRDVESLMWYNAGMAKYSDDGVSFHGAYGQRWRGHFTREDHSCMDQNADTPLDQLAEVIRLLRANPTDRRIVLSMWDPTTDLAMDGLDFPCNTQVYFRVRDQFRPSVAREEGTDRVLDMTITCRSNDMYWGGYGANAVHFSVLQEFVAAMVGVRIGEMHQLSNNAHLYRATMPDVDQMLPYVGYAEARVPLFGDLASADIDTVFSDLDTLWDDDPDGEVELLPATTIQLVTWMRRAWWSWKNKDSLREFVECCNMIPHGDWRRACIEWGERRRDKFR